MKRFHSWLIGGILAFALVIITMVYVHKLVSAIYGPAIQKWHQRDVIWLAPQPPRI